MYEWPMYPPPISFVHSPSQSSCEDVTVKNGQHFSVCVLVPLELLHGETYDVSLVGYSVDGLVSTHTEQVYCQYYKIK